MCIAYEHDNNGIHPAIMTPRIFYADRFTVSRFRATRTFRVIANMLYYRGTRKSCLLFIVYIFSK